MTSFSLRSVIGGTLTHCRVGGGAPPGGGGASHCKHSSLTNKVLLLMINGNEGLCVCMCVSVSECVGREEDNEDDVGEER